MKNFNTICNKEIIRQQRKKALEILSLFKQCEIPIILAGGSLRNWDFNMQARDFDFYIAPAKTSVNIIKDIIRDYFCVSYVSDDKTRNNPYYDRMNIIDSIVYGYAGRREHLLQFIITDYQFSKSDTIKDFGEYVTRDFDFDICKIYQTSDGKCHKTNDYKKSKHMKILTYGETSTKRKAKMQKLFPQWPFMKI